VCASKDRHDRRMQLHTAMISSRGQNSDKNNPFYCTVVVVITKSPHRV
jgi:hypothetical protein